VTQHQQRDRPALEGPGGDQQLAVPGVVQQRLRLVQGDPRHLVDLVVGPVAGDVVVAHHAAHPVVHQLGAPAAGTLVGAVADRVHLGRECRAETDPQAGLLLDLTDRRDVLTLPGVELALGEGPVVVAGSVHEQHLGDAGSSSQRDRACGDHHCVPVAGLVGISHAASVTS
jgi:hypothetical protein